MVSKEIINKSKMSWLCRYVRNNFDNKELISEMNRYENTDVLFLVMWFRENVKDINAFIDDLEKRYKISITEEQHNKIYKYLEVLHI